MKLRTMALLTALTAGAIIAAAWVELAPVQSGARLLAKDAEVWAQAELAAHR